MDFIPLRFLRAQHRFVDKDNPLHKKRARQLLVWRRLVPILDRSKPYDKNFMEWFCGFCDTRCHFKVIKVKKKITFVFVTYHYSYKLLRWIKYNLNFGNVEYSRSHRQFFYYVTRRSHLLILIEIFNGYLKTVRSLRQFYLWLKYYNLIKKMQYRFFLPDLVPHIGATPYLSGLLDAILRFRVYRKYNKKGNYYQVLRPYLYMDIPAFETKIAVDLKRLFLNGHFSINSGCSVRLTSTNFNDFIWLSGYFKKRKPFNRQLKIKFLNWYALVEYLYRLKGNTYFRKDRVRELVRRFDTNYYKIRPKKKRPAQIVWYEIIDTANTLENFLEKTKRNKENKK